MLNRVKEAAFNIANNYFYYEDKIVLDLFSGSGQLGIEALSRGARFCYFNDKSFAASNIIKKNINNLKIDNCIITNKDYLFCLNQLIKNNIKIDLLLLDPPFKQIQYYYKSFELIFKSGLLNNNAVIICESEQKINFNNYILFGIELLKEKTL